MHKKLISASLAAAMVLTAGTALPTKDVETATAADSINYAEALQKSLYFYECQQAGELPEWNRVEWRADSNVDDFITGGWYDAGDHVKFNLPMAYSASMLAWGFYQYSDGVEAVGETTNYVNNLKWVLDYLAACDQGDDVVFQVGNGTEDHTWWGPVELYKYGMDEANANYKRPYYTGTGSAVCGEMAAALAAGYCALQEHVDKATLADYLEHAENIFKIADTARSDADYNDSDASGFYRSSHFYDELFWAANWLYKATGDQAYLDKATSYIPDLGKELGSSDLKYSWCQCWDDVQQGGMLLYAQNTKNATYINQVAKHLDYWCNSESKVDGTLCYVDSWGCLRYANNVGCLAAIACDTIFADDAAKVSKYKALYESQINYSLGDNPDGRSYMVGYDETSPLNAHHRTAHCSWKNDLDIPTANRHILYGALVGGPTQTGDYEDDRGNYINNEVATDYNAGFTALLCKMCTEYGGKTDPSFPEPETRTPEFYVAAMAKQVSASGVSLSLKITNKTAWPARCVDNISYRYYMDLTELIDKGYTAKDVVVRCDRDQSAMYSGVTPAVISEIKPYQDNIYYIEISYPDGRAVLPISEGRYQCETMLALVYPNYGEGWDSSNDYSFQDIGDVKENTMTDKITVYEDGKLIFGTEPDGTVPEAPIGTEPKVTGTTTPPAALPGDLTVDGDRSVSDVVLLSRFLTCTKTLSAQALQNADVDGNETVNALDNVALKQILLKK